MDVLDHSCSKLGFGGKMCIDGTWKFEEEKSDDSYEEIPILIDQQKIMKEFSEITAVNTTLAELAIPCLVMSVRKNSEGHIKDLHQAIVKRLMIAGIKMVLYVEHTVDANDLPAALWRFCNNLDPKRDNILCKKLHGS